MAAYEVLLLNTAIPQIQAAQSGDTYVVPRDIAFSAALTLSAGTANGVPYLNGSKVVTTGSALTFDGTVVNNTGLAPNIRATLTGGTVYTSLASDGVYATGTDLYLFAPASKFLSFYAGNAERARITSTGEFQWKPDGTTQAMTLDASGNLAIGTPTPNSYGSTTTFTINGTTYSELDFEVGGTLQGYISGVSGGLEISADGLRFISLRTDNTERARITSGGDFRVKGAGTAGSTEAFQVSGSAPADAARLDSSGNLLVGTTSATAGAVFKVTGATANSISHQVWTTASSTDAAYWTEGSGTVNGVATGSNAAAAMIRVNKDSGTTRSINAAGSLNASGADYAEYMTKAGNFKIAKGDICGIDENGKLTNVFAKAISFVVKSTDPAYVGGDTWFVEAVPLDEAELPAFKERMELARQMVDRIAFAGQVPVNVIGATAGQYIVPVNDNGAIKGIAVNSPTFEQYQIALGKVIAIESDGRARIIVKVV